MLAFETAIDVPVSEIEAFCKEWRIVEFSLFGSALRCADFTDASDVDVLVVFADGARISLFDMVDMQDELEDMFGRKVDLVSKWAVERSRNKFRRSSILDSARVVYAEG